MKKYLAQTLKSTKQTSKKRKVMLKIPKIFAKTAKNFSALFKIPSFLLVLSLKVYSNEA